MEESIKLHQEIGAKFGEAICLHNIGTIVFHHGDPEKAIHLLSNAFQIFTKMGATNSQKVQESLNVIKQQIGENRYQEIINKIS